MAHPEISRSREPIRLFESGFLEFFTHVHPAVILAIWAPVLAYFLYRAIAGLVPAGAAYVIPVSFVIGLLIWTLAEYILHRFVFHFPARTPRQERLSFLFHGVHHAQPMSKTRLVMPPAVSIPLALLFYGLFLLVVGVAVGRPHWVAPLFAGFATGYLFYDMLHYSMHHLRMRGGYLKFVRRHHMQHHGATPDLRFGVTSAFWDRVFGTEPA